MEVKSATGGFSWISQQTRPDISSRVAQLSQHTQATLTDTTPRQVNSVIRHVVLSTDTGFLFRDMDGDMIYMDDYADPSFAGNAELNSQMGGIACVRDSLGK